MGGDNIKMKVDLTQLKQLRNLAQEKANYYRQRFNIEPTARNMYVRWKAKKQHYDMLIDNARKLTARGVKEMDYSTFLLRLLKEQEPPPWKQIELIDQKLAQAAEKVRQGKMPLKKFVMMKQQADRYKAALRLKSPGAQRVMQGIDSRNAARAKPAVRKPTGVEKTAAKAPAKAAPSPASPPAKPMPQQQPVPKPTGKEKAGKGIIGQVKAAAKAHPKTAAVLAGAALGAGALMAYKRFFSQAARACKGLSGGDKTKCMLQYQAKGVNAAISNLKSKMGQCKGDPKCTAKIQKQIGKYQNKLNKLKSKIG